MLVQFSYSFELDSLQPHGLQHTKLPCPSPTPRVCSNSCPWSQWCHPNISSSVVPIASHLQSFPAYGFFLMSQFFASGGQSIGASASASVFPMNIQDCFPLWGSGKGTETPPGNLTLEASGIWLQYFHRTGKQTLGGHKQNHVHTRSQEKEAVSPEETEPDLPVSAQESPEKAWVNNSWLWGQGHRIQQYR